jgi:ATP-dependent DNA ligase
MDLSGKDLALVTGDHTPEDGDSFFLADYFYQEKVEGVRCAVSFGVNGQPSFLGRRSELRPHFPSSPGPAMTAFDGVLTPQAYRPFDLLALYGQDLRAEPLSWRLSGLEDMILPGWFRCVPTVHSAESGRRLLSYVLDHGGEGIVRKNPICTYPRSEWVYLGRTCTFDLVLLSIDRVRHTAEVGEVVNGSLQALGRIVGVHQTAPPGTIVEVAARKRPAGGDLRHGRWVRFRWDKPAIPLPQLVHGPRSALA